MASTRLLSAAVVTLLAPFSHASEFLRARTSGELQQAMKDSLESTFLSELSKDTDHLRRLEDQLRPMFVALPKNENGKLDSPAVRYALHRHFVHTHGWFVVGLEPLGQGWNASIPTETVKGRVPAFILNLFEQRMKGRGMGLHDLAAFAATLLDFVHNDAVGDVVELYSALNLDLTSSVGAAEAERVVEAFMLQTLDGNTTAKTSADVDEMESNMREWFPLYPDFKMWLTDTRRTTSFERGRSSLDADDLSLASVVADVQALTDRLFKFQDVECRSLKAGLTNMEYKGTGRVLLPDFYSAGLRGDFLFVEHVDYLRKIGALDETDPKHPSVIITNFLTSKANCLTESSFHSVCCLDECQELLGHLESSIAAPSTSPAQIAALISQLPSDTVDAPRNLSTSLMSRLGQIAEHHEGQIPLHSRLFAQWMHHAYPLECPYPHAAGTTRPLTQDEWMELTGADDVTHSEEERMRLAQSQRPSEEEAVELPWVQVEEVVGRHRFSPKASASGKGRKIAAFAAVIGLAVSIAGYAARALLPGRSPQSKVEKFMV